MNSSREYITQFNMLIQEFDGIYHNVATKAGLSDCAFRLLYILSDSEVIHKQSDLAEVASLPPQTVNSALKNLGKAIINEHMTHCINHAIEEGDTHAVEEFQKAVQKFI